MYYAPVMFLAFGFWMCSSKQLLSNEYLTPIQTVTETPLTGHIFTQVFQPKTWISAPAWPLLFLLAIFTLVILF